MDELYVLVVFERPAKARHRFGGDVRTISEHIPNVKPGILLPPGTRITVVDKYNLLKNIKKIRKCKAILTDK